MAHHSSSVTIEEVLGDLNRILETTLDENSPLGIFAFAFLHINTMIAEKIDLEEFEDNERMERFEVELARRYIDAFWCYHEGLPVSSPWKIAFKAAGDTEVKPIILQHLLLGMNAHINLDLGVTTARVAPGDQIHSFKNDFETVQRLLVGWVGEMKWRIYSVSPLVYLLDLFEDHNDGAIVNFSTKKACAFAWNLANILAYCGEMERRDLVRRVEGQIALIGSAVAHPPDSLLPKLLYLIQQFEEKDIREVVKGLRE